MYKIEDYVCNARILMNNSLRPRHKVLSSLMIYTTTRCQSRCRHCSIWKKPDESLTLDDIRKIMASKCVGKETTVGLEGGELVLHPEAEAILSWFAANHPNYTLLSNCLAPERIVDAVGKYRPAHLYVSLDGNRESYLRMRGRDGHDKVIRVVEALRDEVPVSLMFCLSPWNSFADMDYVVGVARRYGVDVRIGIYGTMAFFDTSGDLLATDSRSYISSIPPTVRLTDENYDFVALYDEWRNGRLRLRCRSIFSELVVHSNGDVPLCQNLDVTLGNIHQRSLDDIFNSRRSHELLCRYSKECNGCWINFHRKYDIILMRGLERLLPKRAVELLFGKYQWTADRNETYRQYMSRIAKQCGR